jgi:hypothetical protein
VEAAITARAAVRAEGTGWIEELLQLEPEKLRERLETDRELASPARVQAAIEAARARGREQPETALPLFGLALDLAARLPRENVPAGLIHSLRLSVLLEVTEVWCRLRRWNEAESFLAWCDELLLHSPDDEARAHAARLRRRIPRQGGGNGEDEAGLRRELERLSEPSRFNENLPWRETFLARLTTEHYAYVFRTFGAILEEHLAEFLRYLPEDPEDFPVTDLRAAAADLRYLQAYLASRGRAEFEDEGMSEDQIALVRRAGEIALGLDPILAELEGALAARDTLGETYHA